MRRTAEMHTKVRLQGDGRTTTVWIPSRFATPGRAVRLKDEDNWGPPWLVLSVLDQRPSSEVMPPQ